MAKRKLNSYQRKNNYIIGLCANGTEFIIDPEDYEKVSKYTWRCNKKGVIETSINRKSVSLSRFVLGLSQNDTKKVYLRSLLDFRKENLFYGNRYAKHNNYYNVECFDGTIFKIDVSDYELIKNYTWHQCNGYIVGKVDKKEIKLHRFLLNVSVGDEVDHINRNPLDNRRTNLRVVDRSANCINRGVGKNNTSGHKGVYKISGYNRYGVQININGKRIYLGSFDTYDEACSVRAIAEQKYHQ